MRSRSFVVVVLLLFAPMFAFVPSAEACATTSVDAAGVPCGRIYPTILIRIEGQEPRYEMLQGEEYSWEATLTYKFSVNDNGYTVALPNDPVRVTFEYPRMPDWVELEVAPESLDIPVNDPTYLKPNADDPNNVQVEYEYSTTITITARLNGQQPVLRDGYEFAKLLVFAKSSESGLYQSGYGIKEIRVVPEGHVFESDVAGSRDVFVATPLTTGWAGGGQAWNVAGTGVSFETADQIEFWQPTPVTVTVMRSMQSQPEVPGRLFFSVTEESGAVIAQHGPYPYADQATFNVTFVRPGAHTFALTVLPGDESLDAPVTNSINAPVTFTVRADVMAESEAEGWAFPKSYLIMQRNALPLPTVDAGDALVQFEHEVPFFAFDSAQSTVASVSLVTPGADALGKAASNLEFVVVDDQGKQLAAQTVDPSNPARSIRIGSLPGDGWYALRIRGVGAPDAAAYDVRIEASYALQAEARDRADFRMDESPTVLALAGRNVTLPVDDVPVWAPVDLTPTVEGFPDARYQVSVTQDATERIVYASGLRDAGVPVTFTALAPGTYHATVFAEPGEGAVFAPLVRTFTFTAGEGSETVATTFAIEDDVAFGSGRTLAAVYRIPAQSEGAVSGTFSLPATATAEFVVVDDGGADVARGTDLAELGTLPASESDYTLLVYIGNRGLDGVAQLALQSEFAEPVTLADATGGVEAPAEEVKIPGFALGLGLALIGGVAVALAFVRRG